MMNEFGQGMNTNINEAVRLYREAAENGNSDGQLHLGNCYYNGNGVPKDFAEARRWWEASAEQGNETAQENLQILDQQDGNQGGGFLDKAVGFIKSDTGQGILKTLGTIGGAFAQGYAQASRNNSYYDDDDDYDY